MLENDFDSILMFVDDKRQIKYNTNNELGLVKLSSGYFASKSGEVFIRAYRKGRPYVSHTFNFELFDYNSVIDSYESDFDTDNTDFDGHGFSVRFFDNFSGKAIHSTHNYESNTAYQYILKSPIRVKSAQAFINFDEVVLVQAGQPGADPGSSAFKDFVVVQGSLDGVNWVNLVTEYDSDAKPSWEQSLRSGVPGRQELYRFRAINLLDTFSPDDEVLIRFFLHSDSEIEGWGWAIDNLKIQTETVIAGINNTSVLPSYQVYPNPVTANSFSVLALQKPANSQLTIYSSNGTFELSLNLDVERENEIKLPLRLKNGLYFVVIDEQFQSVTYKLLIDR